jgi:hypothetical protein
MKKISRRTVLKTGITASLAAHVLPRNCTAANAASFPVREKLPVAGVVTVYHKSSHADVILGKILEGFQQDGGAGPDLKLVALYVDQKHEGDLSRGLAEKFGFRMCETIDEALTLGTDQIQVRGVLSIAEHGEYPLTPDTKQHMYPRRRFFDEIATSFRRCGTSVPVFNDKHLSWRFEDAVLMAATARDMKFPLLAGSSVPVAWRYPALELPRDCEIESALTVGYGPFEAYGFHAIEAHQCLLERRRGGETGVAAVQAVSGPTIRALEREGEWSAGLLEAALKTLPGQSRNVAAWEPQENSAAYLFQHNDGLKSAVIMANGLSDQFAIAVKLKGEPEPRATWFKLQESAPYGHFAYLLHAFAETVHRGATVYPVERTVLTTGMMDRVMQSLSQGGVKMKTPELAIRYQSVEWPYANHPQSFMSFPSD